ncbi:MAG: cytochrome c biogenesis protein CcdA [Chloroflexi bacterium]|nr:cytochrome c biogenesis protein CcdA [Chloroflexota bacterium]
MVSAVNPCGFAMLPAYVAFQLGEGAEAQGAYSVSGRALRAVGMGLLVTLGFIAMFAAAGSAIAAGGRALIQVVPWVALVIGGGMVLLGLWSLSGRHLGILAASRVPVPATRGWRAIFLYGLAYGVASLSCTLPVFLAVVGSVLASQGLAAGVGQFVLYALGMGLVLTVVSLATAFFREAVGRSVRLLLPYVERAGAVLLLLAGLLIIFYWLTIGGLLPV